MGKRAMSVTYDRGFYGKGKPAKVVLGVLKTIAVEEHLDRRYQIVSVQAVDGTEHLGRVECVMWMLMWKMGYGTDRESMEWEKMTPLAQNTELRKRKLKPIFFRFDETGSWPVLVGGYSTSYKVFEAEDLESTVRKALPDCVTKTVVPSDGLHGGEVRAVERIDFHHFKAYVHVDMGFKDGKTPLKGYAGGTFKDHDMSFMVSTPALKRFVKSRSLHHRDPALLTPFSIPHNGNPRKKLFRYCRDYGIRNEYVDSVCDDLADRKMTYEDAKTILNFYLKNTGISFRTLSYIRKATTGLDELESMTYLDFCIYIHKCSDVPDIPPSSRELLRNAGSELLCLGGHLDELLEWMK